MCRESSLRLLRSKFPALISTRQGLRTRIHLPTSAMDERQFLRWYVRVTWTTARGAAVLTGFSGDSSSCDCPLLPRRALRLLFVGRPDLSLRIDWNAYFLLFTVDERTKLLPEALAVGPLLLQLHPGTCTPLWELREKRWWRDGADPPSRGPQLIFSFVGISSFYLAFFFLTSSATSVAAEDPFGGKGADIVSIANSLFIGTIGSFLPPFPCSLAP